MVAYFNACADWNNGGDGTTLDPIYHEAWQPYPNPTLACWEGGTGDIVDWVMFYPAFPEFQVIRTQYKIRRTYNTGASRRRRNLPAE